MGEGRRNQHAVIPQYTMDLGKGFLRLRYDVQGVGHDHHLEGLVRIGQTEHIPHRKVQLGRVIIPLCLGDHLHGGVRRLDMRRRVYDVFSNQTRAGGKLQHCFAFTTGRISPYIFSYAALSFRIKRSYRPAFLSQKFLCSRIVILPPRCKIQQTDTHTLLG